MSDRVIIIIFVIIMGIVAVMTDGCYLEHEADPCDAGLQADDAGFEPADGGSSPSPATEWCEGPYVGCIAPGSPLSSTWKPLQH